MSSHVELVYGVTRARRIALAPLTGADERAATDADALLTRLALAEGDGQQGETVHGAALRDLTVGDRDRALAGLYMDLYGSDIRADATCPGCGARYEMRFDLAALSASRQPASPVRGNPPAITLGQSRLRLPRRSDLTGNARNVVAALTLDGPVPGTEAAAAALEAADPALDVDLSGNCPECGSEQAVPFSIAPFLEAALSRDRAFLLREIHLIASAYHWSPGDILSLTRAERHGFARLLIAEREAVSLQMRRAS